MFEFRRIVSATDLSECASVALSYATEIAKRCDAELAVLHANTVIPTGGTAAYSETTLAHVASYQLDAARAALEDYHKNELRDVNARRLVVTGPAPEMIVSTSRVLDADLIVIGTRGRSGLSRILLGSVAEAVVRHADRPVITVRCSDKKVFNPVLRRIVCAVDFSRSSSVTFENALGLAAKFDAELIALHVVDNRDRDIDEAAEKARLREWIGELPVAVRPELLIHGGEAAERVMWYAKEHAADLLVLGARQKTRDNAVVLGATTEMLTRHAPCPVMTVPAI